LHPYFVVPSRLGRFIAVKKYAGKHLKAICEKDKGKITVILFIGLGDRDAYGASAI